MLFSFSDQAVWWRSYWDIKKLCLRMWLWVWLQILVISSGNHTLLKLHSSFLVIVIKSLKFDLNFYFQSSLRLLRIHSNQIKQLFLSRSLDMKLSKANSKIRTPRSFLFTISSPTRNSCLYTLTSITRHCSTLHFLFAAFWFYTAVIWWTCTS